MFVPFLLLAILMLCQAEPEPRDIHIYLGKADTVEDKDTIQAEQYIPGIPLLGQSMT